MEPPDLPDRNVVQGRDHRRNAVLCRPRPGVAGEACTDCWGRGPLQAPSARICHFAFRLFDPDALPMQVECCGLGWWHCSGFPQQSAVGRTWSGGRREDSPASCILAGSPSVSQGALARRREATRPPRTGYRKERYGDGGEMRFLMGHYPARPDPEMTASWLASCEPLSLLAYPHPAKPDLLLSNR
jgi:hypothetical protein